MKRIICVNERKAISFMNQINIGQEYYLDLSTINGDFKGEWYGDVYEDDNGEIYVGHLKLSHFRTLQ